MSHTSIVSDPSIQLVNIASTVVVDRLSSGSHPVPVPHSAAAELNKHVLKDKTLSSGIGPSTSALGAASATSNAKKRNTFSLLGQRADQVGVSSNIDMGPLWNNISLSMPKSKDQGKEPCSLKTRARPTARPIKGCVVAEPPKVVREYTWALGQDLQGLQNDLILKNPTNPSTKSEFDGKLNKAPATIPTSSARPASLARTVKKPVLAPLLPPSRHRHPPSMMVISTMLRAQPNPTQACRACSVFQALNQPRAITILRAHQPRQVHPRSSRTWVADGVGRTCSTL
ncbi:hypothetical protein MSAN_01423800 [Mycena sanguinolenta]|uniref:Uncharacterized protein n=1 Tax=Mycena sanguinolenta TaxID=230812 RepID=A0A8H6Y6D6_9AGAR|nr:hypothetical protein MSAN_01423800 [Mycena sanguinolenta]